MITRCKTWLRETDRNYLLFLLASVFLGIGLSMARATYLRKIAIVESDVSPTLSLGTSIDHIVTMFLPIIGGLVWYNNGSQGYKYVFLGGAVIGVINFISTSFINIKNNMKNPSCS